ncbi:MAG: C40 family peptidase [Deinococcales bacterium]|nr:C40 family peptidase [Chitinophagaceae bacterium]
MAINFKYYFVILIGLIACSSCSTLRKIGSKDASTNKPFVKNNPPHKITFLDNIEVRPGQMITSQHKTSGMSNSPVVYAESKSLPGNIEKADWLQIKYAIVMDAAVETLTNISLFRKIDEWWATKYCMGGSTKSCIDCSAFTVVVMKDIYGINLPRTAQEQYNQSEHIALEDVKEGDLVFFHTSGRDVSHVGIYLANNKFLQASTSSGVTITDMNDKYWQPRFKGAGRVRKY